MARTCLTTMSRKKSAPANCKKSPVMEENDEMQLKQHPKEIANHIKTSESHKNNNVMGNYDNNSTSGKDIGSEIDLQTDQDLEDLEDNNMKLQIQKRKKPNFCKTSVTTSTNSETASIVLYVANKLNLTSKVPNKVMATTKKNAPYDKDKPLDKLNPTETTITIDKATKDIFPTCHFITQPKDADTIIWYILYKLGYDGVNCGQDHSHHWNATGKLVKRMITML